MENKKFGTHAAWFNKKQGWWDWRPEWCKNADNCDDVLDSNQVLNAFYPDRIKDEKSVGKNYMLAIEASKDSARGNVMSHVLC